MDHGGLRLRENRLRKVLTMAYRYRVLSLSDEQYARVIGKGRKARALGKLVLSRRLGMVAHLSCANFRRLNSHLATR